jgi:uncharacterized protein involved in exopolysaccharide biosynthesis
MATENQESIFNFEVIYNSFSIIMANWKKLTIFVFSVTIVTAIILLVVPNYYIAQVTILPPAGKSSFSGLMNLASELGYSSSGDGIINSPQVISRIVRSRVLSEMLGKREYFHNGKNRTLKLREVFKVKEKDPARIEYFTHLALNRAMTTSIDARIKSLDISVKVNDPLIAAELMNAIVEELDSYNKLYRNNKAKSNREFVEKRLKDTGDSLAKYEEALRLFREENRQVTQSPMLMLRQQRLVRKMNVSEELYLLLTKEYETTKIQEVRDTPVLDIIEMAKPLPVKSGPVKRKVLMVVFFLSLATGLSVLLISEQIKKSGTIARLRQLEGYRVMSRDIAAVFKRLRR